MTSYPVEMKRGQTPRNAICRVLSVFLMTNFFAALILAQSQSAPENRPNRCELWGVIVSSNRSSAEGMKIEFVREGEARRQSMRVIQGAFDFPSIHPGIYHFRVIDRSGKIVVWKTQALNGIDDHVVIYLPYAISEPSVKNIVSRVELNHKIPRQARNAFHVAQKADERGDLPESIEAFEKALTIDPRFVEAEINLAMQYTRSRQPEQAIAHAQRAFEMRSGDPDTARTLALILLDAKQYVQIERVARLMLIKQQAVSEMHGLLAISLIGQRRNLDEAFAQLELAAKDFPITRWLAANTLIETGLPKLAAAQINSYLKSSANECERDSLESWIATLTQSQSTMAAIP